MLKIILSPGYSVMKWKQPLLVPVIKGNKRQKIYINSMNMVNILSTMKKIYKYHGHDEHSYYSLFIPSVFMDWYLLSMLLLRLASGRRQGWGTEAHQTLRVHHKLQSQPRFTAEAANPNSYKGQARGIKKGRWSPALPSQSPCRKSWQNVANLLTGFSCEISIFEMLTILH